MKTLVKKLSLVVLLLSAAFSVQAIEYKWTDHQGNRHFDCGGFSVGGEAVVKARANGIYRVKSVLINRTVRASSIYHAAQIACGEKEEYEQQQTTNEEKGEE